MNGLPYYKAYPRDFIEGTIGMPFEVKGAYRLVLDAIYMQGGNLPDDPRYISGLLGCSVRKWKTLRETLVSMGKLRVSGEFLTNFRADKELETLRTLQDKNSENRSRPNKNKDLQSRPCDHTEPEPDTVTKVTGADAPPDPVKVMFDTGVALLTGAGVPERQARTLLGKWRKAHGTEAVITAIGRAQREGAVDPVSFIEGCFKFQRKAGPQVGQVREVNGCREVYRGGVDGWVREFA